MLQDNMQSVELKSEDVDFLKGIFKWFDSNKMEELDLTVLWAMAEDSPGMSCKIWKKLWSILKRSSIVRAKLRMERKQISPRKREKGDRGCLHLALNKSENKDMIIQLHWHLGEPLNVFLLSNLRGPVYYARWTGLLKYILFVLSVKKGIYSRMLRKVDWYRIFNCSLYKSTHFASRTRTSEEEVFGMGR
ncbi:unnamed protein product [Lactuca virosa]|uniref:Uncharacterized protein n=1 Tax=Lactuca virosa TaxID=75947 RepID=A0AAU9N8G3_9ASTR|nr:unnamed protein product [Lactuca virosa]